MFQPEDLLAEFDEEDDAINIDDKDGNWPDLEGSDRNDDPQNKTTKGNSNKRKSTEPPNGIQQTYVRAIQERIQAEISQNFEGDA